MKGIRIQRNGSAPVELVHPLKVKRSRLFVAGPTSGKTFLEQVLRNRGANVVDTDHIYKMLFPDYWDARGWRTASDDVRKAADVMVGEHCARVLLADPDAICLSNLWGPHFLSCFSRVSGCNIEGKFPVGVYRSSPEEVVQVNDERQGSHFPLKLVRKWVESTAKFGPSIFASLVWLDPPKEEGDVRRFMSDAIDVVYDWLLPVQVPLDSRLVELGWKK